MYLTQVAKHVQPLIDLKAMFAADSADAYLLAYSSLLQVCMVTVHDDVW